MKIQLQCFTEVILINPFPEDQSIQIMKNKIRECLDVFITEVSVSELDVFHHINYGKQKLFIYMQRDGERSVASCWTVGNPTKSRPNPNTWNICISVNVGELSSFSYDEFGMLNPSFDIVEIIKNEDILCKNNESKE